MLAGFLNPLQLPSAAAHLKMRDLINFLTLTLIQDLFSHDITTQDCNNFCLGFMALLQDDSYDATSINNLNSLLEIIEQRETSVTTDQEAYKNIKRALNHLMKTQGARAGPIKY